MKRLFLALVICSSLPAFAQSKVWCENPQKPGVGYWAEKCPDSMKNGEPAKTYTAPTNPFTWRPRVGMTRAEAEAAFMAGVNWYHENERDSSNKHPREDARWVGYTLPRINKTESRFGVREQWVIGGGRYLYFDNDILTSIQE